jgi:acyclic terpene utilization AtuA family protein
MTDRAPVVRIANCSGFLGDRIAAAREMVNGGPIDVLTGDYLAELTMLILWKARSRGRPPYATSFLVQMEEVLGTCLDRGIRIVANAGGLDPAGLAAGLDELAGRLGLAPRVAYIEGDDVLARLTDAKAAGHPLAHLDNGRPLSELHSEPVTANAYLGARGIAEALYGGADVVICPRVTDASLVVGPAAWWFDWGWEDWDRLAGAVVAGHVLECGPQTTGGNFSFFTEVPGLEHPGFPIAEVSDDGTSVITKHPGAGGLVSVETVTSQILYEIDGARYYGPDVTARFDTIELEQIAADRVRITSVRGEAPSGLYKVAINYVGGYRNSMTFVLTGLDIERKAALAEKTLWHLVGGPEQFERVDTALIRTDHPDSPGADEANALLRITVMDAEAAKVGRAFSNRVTEMTLASYPGFHTTTPPSGERTYGVYWPTLIPAEFVTQTVVHAGGRRVVVPPPRAGTDVLELNESPASEPQSGWARTRRLPLGTLIGARSGDKGGNANVGVFARSAHAYAWLFGMLTVDRFQTLLPETAPLPVRRCAFPRIRSLNFVVVGLLSEGVAASVRSDPQAKSLGEHLRSRWVDIPTELLEEAAWIST